LGDLGRSWPQSATARGSRPRHFIGRLRRRAKTLG
jgi:hypothetical protein